MVSDKYRMHRLRAGDEWALSALAKGNARFGEESERPWVSPLTNDEASEFVSDPRTVCVVAIDMVTSNMVGFAYGCVLYRRHTRLRHLCLYEIGIDVDHRSAGVDQLLLHAIGAEARQMGIEQGFAFASSTDTRTRAMYESIGAMRSNNDEILFGLQF